MTNPNDTTEQQIDELIDLIMNIPHDVIQGLPPPEFIHEAEKKTQDLQHKAKNEARAAFLALIAERERLARLQELLNIPFNDDRFSNEFIGAHWKARIEQLSEEGE